MEGHEVTRISDLQLTPVYTSDGVRLGVVSGTSGPFFRVSRRWRRDFWLATEYVLVADSKSVIMDFRYDRLQEYRRYDAPELPVEIDVRRVLRRAA
jgi:hypothetical protein